MPDVFKDFYETTSIIDIIYIFLTFISLVKCYKKGFVLSVLSIAKWLLAYIITLIIFPTVKPYFKNIIDSEYVLDIGLGISIFVIVKACGRCCNLSTNYGEKAWSKWETDKCTNTPHPRASPGKTHPYDVGLPLPPTARIP